MLLTGRIRAMDRRSSWRRASVGSGAFGACAHSSSIRKTRVLAHTHSCHVPWILPRRDWRAPIAPRAVRLTHWRALPNMKLIRSLSRTRMHDAVIDSTSCSPLAHHGAPPGFAALLLARPRRRGTTGQDDWRPVRLGHAWIQGSKVAVPGHHRSIGATRPDRADGA
jgi:hypothetical protein